MFHLYGNVAGWKELDVSKDEIDILETIENHIKANSRTDYLVIDKHPDIDLFCGNILNEKDLEEYKQKVLTKKRGF